MAALRLWLAKQGACQRAVGISSEVRSQRASARRASFGSARFQRGRCLSRQPCGLRRRHSGELRESGEMSRVWHVTLPDHDGVADREPSGLDEYRSSERRHPWGELGHIPASKAVLCRIRLAPGVPQSFAGRVLCIPCAPLGKMAPVSLGHGRYRFSFVSTVPASATSRGDNGKAGR